jgi:hypothetical protein
MVPDAPDAIRPADVKAFEHRLFHEGIRIGLLFTAAETVIVRDTLASMKYEHNVFHHELIPTSTLFDHIGVRPPHPDIGLVAQVRRWVVRVRESWSTALPGSALAIMIPDVTGHIMEAVLEEVVDS